MLKCYYTQTQSNLRKGRRQRNIQHTVQYNLMSTEPTGQFQYSLSEVL